MANPVVHFEIGCRDEKKAGAFYSGLFDWKLEQKNGQTMLRTGEPIGGHLAAHVQQPPNYTIFYVMVENIDESIAKTESLGGRKIVGPVAMDGSSSRYAWIADPEGNVIGLYEIAKK